MRILLSCHARHNNMRHFPKHFTFLYFIFAIRGQKTERNEGKSEKRTLKRIFEEMPRFERYCMNERVICRY